MSGEIVRARSGRELVTFEELRRRVGAPATYSQWHTIDQATVNAFAEVSGDKAFIHVDPERASDTPFGGTVVHGLYLLSLTPTLLHEATPLVRGTKMSANYGYDRVRFVTPVPVGSRVRAAYALTEVEERAAGFFLLHYDVTLEIEGQVRPACTTHWLIARWMARDVNC